MTDSLLYFYKTAQASLVEVRYIQSKLLAVHLVITVPWVTRENTFVSYNIRQTGFYLNNKCYMMDLPQTVIETENHGFKSMDGILCSTDELPLCYAQPAIHLPTVLCLQDRSSCSLMEIVCRDRFVFDSSGLLVFKEGTLHTLSVANKPKIESRSTGPTNTLFIAWRDVSMVQLNNNQSIYSPNAKTTYIVRKEEKILTNSSLVLPIDNLSEDVEKLAENLQENKTKARVTMALILSLVGLLLLLAVGMGGVLLWIKYRRNEDNGPAEPYDDHQTDETHDVNDADAEYLQPLRS